MYFAIRVYKKDGELFSTLPYVWDDIEPVNICEQMNTMIDNRFHKIAVISDKEAKEILNQSRLSDLQAVADKLYKAIVKIGDDEDIFFGDSAVESLSAYGKLMEQK